MLKHIKLFESFLSEATATVVTTKEIKINRKLEDTIREAIQLDSEIKKLTEKFNKSIAPMQDAINALKKKLDDKVNPAQENLEKLNLEIMESFKKLKINQVRVEDTVTKLMQKKGNLTYSYKGAIDEALTKVNAASAKIIKAAVEAHKNQSTKEWIEREKLEEGVKDWFTSLVAKVKEWAKSVWSSLKSAIAEHGKATDDLEKLAKKIETK